MINFKIVYGTTNPAKIQSMKKCLDGLPCNIIGLNEINIKQLIHEINEDGNDPLENAVIKARAYAGATDLPVFSCDSGLYINGLPKEEQPGVHIRRVNNKRLDDDQMIAHYSAVAKKMGGKMMACYRNAICLIINGKEYTHFDESLAGESFILCDTPHKERTTGFPLDSISIHIDSGKYFYDLTKYDTQISKTHNGFYLFFERILCKQIV